MNSVSAKGLLLDLAAIAVPAGFTDAGLPFGITLMGPSDTDQRLLSLGGQLHARRSARAAGIDPRSPGWRRDRSGGLGAAARELRIVVAGIPAPLGIGKLALADGSGCSGFLCEAWAVEAAKDITLLGNWREYLRGQ